MTKILFLCAKNACLSQMAEGFMRARQLADVEVTSAGIETGAVNPLVMRVMQEAGIDTSACRAKLLQDIDTRDFDIVIMLCGSAAEKCPVLPGYPARINWNLPEPNGNGTGQDADVALNACRQMRDTIRGLVNDFIDRGYLAAFEASRQRANLILNNVRDGIIAHDLQRRVVFFNSAAEAITGYRREEVINRDCHDVFPGNFCGGKCVVGEDGCVPSFEVLKQEVELTTKSGERRTVEMNIRPLLDGQGERVGLVASFHDVTRERHLARRARELEQFSGIIGRDAKMLEVFDLIRELADSNVPVMIQGESGTGKELVAAAIHNEGPRAGKLFVPVNCGALPEALLESELFGHVKGSFTGAIRDKKGRFELAAGGTIFLDEIGDITPAMQVKLLRVLQEGKFERVGSEQTLRVDVRVISATNKNIAEEIARGRFREDLFYRLSVVPLFLPALRERRHDIPLLIAHTLKRILQEAGRGEVKVSAEAMDVMMSHNWPGNVRELQNWLQFALVKCHGDTIRPEHLPPIVAGIARPVKRRRLRKLDIEAVRDALRQTGGSKIEAARVLGVSRATLYRFLDDAGDAE
jgi:PAS domain S-box-containing protein